MSNIFNVFNITQCNIAQMIAESSRFLFQVLLIHVATCIIEGKDEIFSDTLFKTLLITAMAIVMYHIFFRKLVEPKLEKMKIICIDDHNKRKTKLKKVHNKDILRSKRRKKLDSKLHSHSAHTNSTITISNESTESTKNEITVKDVSTEYGYRYRTRGRARNREKNDNSYGTQNRQ